MGFFEPSPSVKRAIAMARTNQYPWVEEGPVGDLLLDALAEGIGPWLEEKKGFLYLAKNESWPSLYKIGCTRKSVTKRLASVGAAGVPTPWVACGAWAVYDAHGLEAQVHRVCADYHVKGELFKAEEGELTLRIEQVLELDAFKLKTYLSRVFVKDVLDSTFIFNRLDIT